MPRSSAPRRHSLILLLGLSLSVTVSWHQQMSNLIDRAQLSSHITAVPDLLHQQITARKLSCRILNSLKMPHNALGRTTGTGNADGSVTKSLEVALSDFGSALTDDERKQFQQIKEVPDTSAALIFTAELEASKMTRRGRSIGARAFSMLQSVQQFSAIVETFVSSHPEVAAL